MRSILLAIIRLYQRTLSPDHGILAVRYPYGYCKFYPSCSEYSAQAIHVHGVKGILLSLRRLGRCNPWNHGGIDRVPQIKGSTK